MKFHIIFQLETKMCKCTATFTQPGVQFHGNLQCLPQGAGIRAISKMRNPEGLCECGCALTHISCYNLVEIEKQHKIPYGNGGKLSTLV